MVEFTPARVYHYTPTGKLGKPTEGSAVTRIGSLVGHKLKLSEKLARFNCGSFVIELPMQVIREMVAFDDRCTYPGFGGSNWFDPGMRAATIIYEECLHSIRDAEAAYQAENVKKKYSFSISHIDTCFPDYLQDHHNRDGEALVGVYVDKHTMIGEVCNLLIDEISGLDQLPEEINEDQIEEAVREEYAGFNRKRAFDEDLEEYDENGERPQAWFLLTWEEVEED